MKTTRFGLRNDLGSILEQLIDQASWNFNAGFQPAEKQARPLNQNTERETGGEDGEHVWACMWRKKTCTNAWKQQGVWEGYFSPLHPGTANYSPINNTFLWATAKKRRSFTRAPDKNGK